MDVWWEGDTSECYWLESTDRESIGNDLFAPIRNRANQDTWRYTLFRNAKVGDVVFHYDKNKSAITSFSFISGSAIDAPIVWAARGVHARARQAKPAEVPGYRIPLSNYTRLQEIVTLEAIRKAKPQIKSLLRKIELRGKPAYFPFEVKDRDIRPLQGYAFKLPADFLNIFPSLGSATDVIRANEVEIFNKAVRDIEAAAPSYKIAKLQEIRTKNLGLKRTLRSIFPSQNRGEHWTFHWGGRNELQFNLGIDQFPNGVHAFRFGIAFSLEPSRSFPDIEVLLPKVEKFNQWMREHPETLSDLHMWHWRKNTRSPDYVPVAIPAAMFRPNTFIFLGDRQPLLDIDAHVVLAGLDRLMPLYEWVESSARDSSKLTADFRKGFMEESAQVILGPGRAPSDREWGKASIPERTLDVSLRHRKIQRLLAQLLNDEGCTDVRTEAQLGQHAVDLTANHGKELWFYEIKTASNARACLREAIGQLLEYALWPRMPKPHRLVVVGESELDFEAKRYVAILNTFFEIPIDYRQIIIRD